MIGRTLSRLALAPILVFSFANSAWAEAKQLPLDKVFPYLERYLELPVAERNRFTLDYRLLGDSKGLQTVRAALVEKSGAVPLAIGADGRFTQLPTLQQFRDNAQLSLDAATGVRLGLALSVDATAKPAREMDAADLAAALVQAQAGEQKLAGLLAFAAPKLTRVAFEGVSAGEAVGPDGRARPLPLSKGRPVFDPAAQKGVKILRFPAAPARAELISGD